MLSWLIAFNVVNTRNQFVAMVGDFLYRITEPVLRPIRNLMPNLGGIDISPVIVILLIVFIETAHHLVHAALQRLLAPGGLVLSGAASANCRDAPKQAAT